MLMTDFSGRQHVSCMCLTRHRLDSISINADKHSQASAHVLIAYVCVISAGKGGII